MRGILTAQEMRCLEQNRFAAGLSSIAAMEAAGMAVAQRLMDKFTPASVLVLCGPGNNGGDGFVVARQLVQAGWDAHVATFSAPGDIAGDAAVMRDRWSGKIETLEQGLQRCAHVEVLVDALFGIGFNRPLDASLAAMIRNASAQVPYCLAIDVPSGVHTDTGQILSDIILATQTITFGAYKPCHVLEPARTRCGHVAIAEIGLEPERSTNDTALFHNEITGVDAVIARDVVTHKYARGAVMVVSGGISTTGASRLAARAALRSGAGLVTLLTPQEALAVNAAQVTAVMVRPFSQLHDFLQQAQEIRTKALVMGPGLGAGMATQAMVLGLLEGGHYGENAGLVLDADALTSFEADPNLLFAAIGRCAQAANKIVLTPHEGEFARLFKSAHSLPSKVERARAAAAMSGATILLKGPDTVIARPDGWAVVNDHASPWLATAGSGDVLAGFIAGLLAQGAHGCDAARWAAWLHGQAGRCLGPGLIAEDLAEFLPTIYKELLN